MQCLGVVVLTTVLIAMGAAVEPPTYVAGSNPIIPKINPLQSNIENSLPWYFKGLQEFAPNYLEEPAVFSEGTKPLCQLKELRDGDEEEGATKRGAMPMQALASGRFGRSSLAKKVPLAALSTGRFGRSPHALEKVPFGALKADRFGSLPMDALLAGRFGRATGLPNKLTIEALTPGRFGRSVGGLNKKVPLEALAAGRFGRSGSLTKKVPLAALAVGRFGRDDQMAPREVRNVGVVSLRMPLAALATGRFGRSAPTEDSPDTSRKELEARGNAREEEIEAASENEGSHPQLDKASEPNQTTPRMKSTVSRRRFDFSKLPLEALRTGRFKRQRETSTVDDHRGDVVPTNMPSLKESYGNDSTVRYSPSMAYSTANHGQGTDQQDDYV
ncbi:Hypp5292 [Branchiostoma lanceolatum]|uniref:Hypp5292 protein n=1 Tax=Branchiostoma lanceolatum TaxID=7740 RepID=A0A8K0EZ25_BRALA|nr:Hypp5292 [Branchiostoma lanceolatum]